MVRTGVKFDDDKPMMDLIPPVMELEVSKVLTFGAGKYAPDNWRKVPDLRRR
ncbi:dATP/dGTP diphosphohydrolase domain-containing protein, partial [Marinobacter sp.]|uniref:dATP/dGTP diphosphohydrolase domain-containing protein n=1 Tax=Marinobacter sp. TaxID=50741 RepID=UPI003566F2EA